MIPSFPEFKPIELADRESLEGYFRDHPPLISELTFTNFFAWRKVHNYQLSGYKDGFLVLKGFKGKASFLQPLVGRDFPGLYQAINWEFLKNEASGFQFVNREQDMGVDGLRKAKLSYNPVRMIKKYRITPFPPLQPRVGVLASRGR